MHLHPLGILQLRSGQKHAACLSQSGLRTSVLEVQSVSREQTPAKGRTSASALLLSHSDFRSFFLCTLSRQTGLEGDITHV